MAILSRRDRLIALGLLTFTIYAAALAFSAVVPLMWHEKFYIDGLTIANSTPSFDIFGSSFNSAAYLLKPWLSLADLMGGKVSAYGSEYGFPLLLTNSIFGISFLAGFIWFAAKFTPVVSWYNVFALAATLVLLAPFYFCITKELIMFLAAILPLAIWARRPHWVKLGVAIYVASMIFLGLYFRSYYLLYGLVLCVNSIALRRASVAFAVYTLVLIFIFAFFKQLPWDLLTKGRADYLEGVSSSRIEYFLSDDNFVGFIGNRGLAFLTTMFPLNLMVRSPAYAPFVLLQCWISVRILQALKSHCGGAVGFSANALLSFTLIQALFEPDYGSFFRHRVGLMLFILVLLCRFPTGSVMAGFARRARCVAAAQSLQIGMAGRGAYLVR